MGKLRLYIEVSLKRKNKLLVWTFLNYFKEEQYGKTLAYK